jgi:mono/diheme cytochrome c family protein
MEGLMGHGILQQHGRHRRWMLLGGVLLLVLSACSGSPAADRTSTTQPGSGVLDQAFTAPDVPALDADRIVEGAELYEQNCATCHKADRSGDPNWKIANDDGIFPPPPHDNAGHTWHHPDALLAGYVMDGLEGAPSGMPQFRGKLTDDQVRSILEFFKSEWGEDERTFQWQVTWQDQQ